VLAVWEDLHWADPSTLETLGLLVEQAPTATMLHVLTFRPEFPPPWPSRSHMTPLTLSRLERPQVEALVHRLAGGKQLPEEVVAHIVGKTDGVPLYVEELTKMLLTSDLLREEAEQYVLTGPLLSVAIPDTLQDSLMARLDQMNTAKEVAQLGSVLGREFPYAMLQALYWQDEATLQTALAQLVQAELLYQRGRPPRARYLFKHALIQDAAYASLLRSVRQGYHQQVAQLLEAQFPEVVETQPEVVAHHYTAAACPEQAIGYWQRAGDCSKGRSAYAEAVAHYTKGLAMLQILPDTPTRPPHELDMQVALGEVLQFVKGPSAPEVGHAYARARELCQQAEDSPRLFAVLVGLAGFYMQRGENQTARELREQLLTLAQRQHDPEYLARAHAVLGHALLYLGEFAAARAHLEQALACAAPQDDSRPSPFNGISRVRALGHTAWVLWWLGYPDQAQTRSHEMLTCAQALQHTHTLLAARNCTAALHKLRGEADVTLKWAEAILALATEQEFGHYVGLATFYRGWALAVQGQHAEGIAQMHQGLAAQHAIETGVTRAELLARLGEAYGRSNQTEEGLRLLAEALAVKENDPWYEAELYRIQGELLLRQTAPDTPQAEDCFQQALAVACRQQAKSYELRAATSLARLWQQQGKHQEAYDLLAPVYGWFTEGFDTADLQEAKRLLDELSTHKGVNRWPESSSQKKSPIPCRLNSRRLPTSRMLSVRNT
jgi:predicted ATPase